MVTEKEHVGMYRRLLSSISRYSNLMLEQLSYGAGDFPQWTNNLISESRTHIADVTHFLRGKANEGIRYGTADHGRAYMATANLRQIHEYANECLSLLEPGAGVFPAWVENKISVVAEYMDLIGHWLENEGVEGRQYGYSRRVYSGHSATDALYQGRADAVTGQHRNPYSPNDARRDVYEEGFGSGSGPSIPHQGSSMGRGRGRDRRNRRYGFHLVPYWNLPHEPVHPAFYPGQPREVYHENYGAGPRLPEPTRTGQLPMEASRMEWMMPQNRMTEAHRQGLAQRMLYQQTGRRFGVPGFVPGQPGWAGAGGVAQLPRPSRGLGRTSSPSFGPGLHAGQGGVQTFQGGRAMPMGVQTYGSLGYGSMGDGSMDMAVRGYAGSGKRSRRKRSRRRGRRSR